MEQSPPLLRLAGPRGPRRYGVHLCQDPRGAVTDTIIVSLARLATCSSSNRWGGLLKDEFAGFLAGGVVGEAAAHHPLSLFLSLCLFLCESGNARTHTSNCSFVVASLASLCSSLHMRREQAGYA